MESEEFRFHDFWAVFDFFAEYSRGDTTSDVVGGKKFLDFFWAEKRPEGLDSKAREHVGRAG